MAPLCRRQASPLVGSAENRPAVKDCQELIGVMYDRTVV